MFTGIIEELGKLKSLKIKGQSAQAVFTGRIVLGNTKIGDSISVNGVCQTVTDITSDSFSVEISSTTLQKTTLSELKSGQFVNLERAMKVEDRLGGHFVQGHVNGTGTIQLIKDDESMILLKIKIQPEFIRLTIDEGSIAIDGISLTVSEKNYENNTVSIRIIPHTFANTILQFKKAGDKVNIETDMIGRYIDSLINNKQIGNNNMTISSIQKMGF